NAAISTAACASVEPAHTVVGSYPEPSLANPGSLGGDWKSMGVRMYMQSCSAVDPSHVPWSQYRMPTTPFGKGPPEASSPSALGLVSGLCVLSHKPRQLSDSSKLTTCSVAWKSWPLDGRLLHGACPVQPALFRTLYAPKPPLG